MSNRAEPGTIVYVVRTAAGSLCSIKANEESAESVCAAWNEDPYNDDGTPDTDAPYRVERWVVS